MGPRHLDRRAFVRRTTALTGAAALGVSGLGARVSLAQSTPSADSGTPLSAENREGQFLERDGASIFYQVTGEGDAMLLLHGYPLSGALFDRNRDALAEAFQVITIDHRGYGESETEEVPDSIAIYAEDALAVLDEVGVDQAIVGGMSMGGPIAFEMYALAPDRIRGLVLIDTNDAAATPFEAGQWNGAAEMVEMAGSVDALTPLLLPTMLTGATRMADTGLVDFLTDVILTCSTPAALGGARALANRDSYTGLLGEIEVPALVLVGEEDALYSFEVSMQIQAALAQSELVIIPGAAHAAIIEAADEANQAILDWASGI